MIGEKRIVHIKYGRADIFVLNKLIADAFRFHARPRDDQRNADNGIVMIGRLAAPIVVHEHFAVIGYKDKIAVLHPASLLQSLEDAADLFVDVDEISKVELAVVAPVWQLVRPIPVVRTVTNRIGDEIVVDHLQESLRWMKRGMGLHIADMRVEGVDPRASRR